MLRDAPGSQLGRSYYAGPLNSYESHPAFKFGEGKGKVEGMKIRLLMAIAQN